ncbi:MAG: hypothetical protein HUK22_02260 [Thermoguttaceae bacterium]|nr:hypothetical protein [Thermoguttaceae bacterium]
MNDYQTTIDRIRMILTLTDGTPTEDLRTLAEEYSQACLEVNRRLADCAKFLRSGNPSEALRLAETAPNVLDLCNLLDFPERAVWDDVCQTYRLTRPTPFSAETIESLNAAFEEIKAVDGLLRRNRFLALARAPLTDRLEVLYALAAADPTNLTWSDSIPQLERALDLEIEKQLDALDDSFASADVKRATAQRDRLADSRRVTPVPDALARKLREYLRGAERVKLGKRFEKFAAEIERARASESVEQKRFVQEKWNELTGVAKRVGATAPAEVVALASGLAAEVQALDAAESARRRADSLRALWMRKLEEASTLAELSEVWERIQRAVGDGEIPESVLATRSSREDVLRAEKRKKTAKTSILAAAFIIVFILAAFGLAAMLL